MTKSDGLLGYDRLYKDFHSPLTKTVRAAAYARDIGQHSWVSAEELEAVIPRLRLSAASRVLDLGCGPGGPLTFVVLQTGCSGVGFDLSANAIAAARERAAVLAVASKVEFHEGDLNQALPFESRSFDAVMSLDVILHLRDRAGMFGEVGRVLKPDGAFFLTDAGIATGAMTEEEKRQRASTAPMQFVAPDFNAGLLAAAGFRLIDFHDSTQNVLTVAAGRLSARKAYEEQLKRQEGAKEFAKQQLYLETVVALSLRRALSRMSYLAEIVG